MKRIWVSQRVEHDPTSGETRDALDRAWHDFLAACGLLGVPLPNRERGLERRLAALPCEGLLLTGGNDLGHLGGDAPERDAVELALVRHALGAGLPVLGVCRGMQLLLHACGVPLVAVEGHVQARQEIEIEGVASVVNSYHRWGCRAVGPELAVWARASDGVVKAVRHRSLPLQGILWHPERMQPFRPDDLALFRKAFGVAAGTSDDATEPPAASGERP